MPRSWGRTGIAVLGAQHRGSVAGTAFIAHGFRLFLTVALCSPSENLGRHGIARESHHLY